MHDLSYFREHLDLYAEMAKRRGMTLDLEGFRGLDRERRELITATEQLKAQSDRLARQLCPRALHRVAALFENMRSPS